MNSDEIPMHIGLKSLRSEKTQFAEVALRRDEILAEGVVDVWYSMLEVGNWMLGTLNFKP